MYNRFFSSWVLTPVTRIQAEGCICQLHRGVAVFDVPLLFRLVVDGFDDNSAAAGRRCRHNDKPCVHLGGKVHGTVAVWSLGPAGRGEREHEERSGKHVAGGPLFRFRDRLVAQASCYQWQYGLHDESL